MMAKTTTVPRHPPPHFQAAAPAINPRSPLFMLLVGQLVLAVGAGIHHRAKAITLSRSRRALPRVQVAPGLHGHAQ